MLPERTDVLIVGAGPTGLALAIALAQSGIDHVLVDRLAAGQNTSRAAVLHAHTLEVLEPLGVTEALADRGLRLAQFSVRDRDRTLLRLRFDHLPSAYRYILMLPQDETERVLAARLAALGGSIHRGVTAVEIAEEATGARATLETPDGPQSVIARYVVGADGMHSMVREAAGIPFTGAAYEGSFVLADVGMQWPLGTTEVSLFFSPEGMLVVAPLPDGGFRIVAEMRDAPEQPDRGDVQALVDARGPAHAASRIEAVRWSSRFRLHHRVADRYRSGRMLLLGDAAHVHSPAGGQGMNTGIVDAVLLGQMLTEVVAGRRPDAWLDGYGAQRRPAAEKVLALAGRMTGMATAQGASAQFLRNTLLSAVNLLPPARRRIELDLSGLAREDLARIAA
jgi:2-polyprenyl-6-methoxyphenol hydroxylase-like FAD-dependent oxidoreductase